MSKLLLYKDWLDSFKREVDEEIDRLRRAPAAAPAADTRPLQDALEGLRAWWDRAYEDPTVHEASLATFQINKELALSRTEVGALKAELERTRGEKGEMPASLAQHVKELLEENRRLEERVAILSRESAGLKHFKDLKGELDQELGGLRLRMSAIRGEYEARLKIQQERVEFLERRAAGHEADLKEEKERRLAAEKSADEGRKRLAEADALRAELRAVRGELSSKLETAAEFLEAKIRGVQDQSKGQGQQLRDLVDALRRLREV
ncbi:MAG: hypothetical protein HY925_07445 [Elusimicrobia bacterium]|nr:hypothetical protein [Elusimicrobiota bacterium]